LTNSLKSMASFRPVASSIPAICKRGAKKAYRQPQGESKSLRCGQSLSATPLQKATLSAWCVANQSRWGSGLSTCQSSIRIQLPESAMLSPAATGHYRHLGRTRFIHSQAQQPAQAESFRRPWAPTSYAREGAGSLSWCAVLLGDRRGDRAALKAMPLYGHWIECSRAEQRVLFQVLSEARQAADFDGCPNSDHDEG